MKLRIVYLLSMSLLLLLAIAGGAHADPSTSVTAAADTGWDAFAKDGPIWGGLLLTMGLLRTFLNKQHWIHQGRLLSGLTGASMILAAVATWHFDGGPASGILTAGFAAFTLFTHSTSGAAKAPSGPPTSTGAAVLAVLLLGGVATQAGCGSGLTAKGVAVAGGNALIDCGETEARNILVQRIVPVVLQVLVNSTSADGKLVDTAPIKSAIGKIGKGDAYDEARIVLTCAAKVAFAKLAAPTVPAPGAPQAAALVADRTAVLRAEADVMATVAPGMRFAVEVK